MPNDFTYGVKSPVKDYNLKDSINKKLLIILQKKKKEKSKNGYRLFGINKREISQKITNLKQFSSYIKNESLTKNYKEGINKLKLFNFTKDIVNGQKLASFDNISEVLSFKKENSYRNKPEQNILDKYEK